MYALSAHKDETAFMAFLEQLLQAMPSDEALVVVLDNAGYHKSLAHARVVARARRTAATVLLTCLHAAA